MSVQAGLWHFDGRAVDPFFLQRVSNAVATYGPDSCNEWFLGSTGMIYRAYHTTPESKIERQPHIFANGKVMTWDGRLDNRDDLMFALTSAGARPVTDVEIVAAAYDRWGTECFQKLIGDWALSIWDPETKSLVLARDYMAVRHLYYHVTPEKVFWCSHLAPIVLYSGAQFTVNDEYVAGHIVMHPDANLTPYQEIHAVPPGSFAKVHNGNVSIQSYWRFQPQSLIRYKTDAEYEEHYRHVLRQAVRRRLRTDSPVLAELSGGFDSSAIVCMADDILAREGAPAKQVDTLSFYAPHEREMDDHLYFVKVEEKRGRKGFHVDSEADGTPFTFGNSGFCPTPIGQITDHMKPARLQILREGGYRVVLTGVGGDEFNGQCTDPRVLMADLIVQFRFIELGRQLKAWSLLSQRPWMGLFYQACLELLPLSVRARLSKLAQSEPFIDKTFSRRHRLPQRKMGESGGPRFWPPSIRDWAGVPGVMARDMHDALPSLEEKTHPYLDRDFIEFVSAVPYSQMIRPGQRRSLMRRALVNYLPKEVLTRKTKAATGRFVSVLTERQWPEIERISDQPLSAHFGYVDAVGFRKAALEARAGNPTSMVNLTRVLLLEYWLRDVTRRGLVSLPGNEAFPLGVDLAQSQA